MSKVTKKSKLKFMTEETNKRRRIGYFFLGFGIFAVLLGSISVFMLLRAYNYDLSNIIAGETKEETTVPETEPVVEEINGEYNFLVIETSNDSKDIYLMAIINVNLSDKKFNVCCLPADAQLFESNNVIRLKDCFEKDKAKGVSEALDSYGIDITRYVCIKERDLKKIINNLGGVVVNSDKSIDYDGEDFDFVLLKGKQTLKGDTAVKYLRYSWDNAENKLQKQAQLICDLLEQSFTEKNLSKGDSLFNGAINLVDTNITIVDYRKSQSKIEKFIKSEKRTASEVVANIDKMKKI